MLWQPRESNVEDKVAVPYVSAIGISRGEKKDGNLKVCGLSHSEKGGAVGRHPRQGRQGLRHQQQLRDEQVKHVMQAILAQQGSREHRLHLPPALAKYISEMWNKATH